MNFFKFLKKSYCYFLKGNIFLTYDFSHIHEFFSRAFRHRAIEQAKSGCGYVLFLVGQTARSPETTNNGQPSDDVCLIGFRSFVHSKSFFLFIFFIFPIFYIFEKLKYTYSKKYLSLKYVCAMIKYGWCTIIFFILQIL